MNEKKWFIIAIIAYVALVFVCWDDSITTGHDGRTILTFWHTYGDHEEAVLHEIINNWEEKNASFTIRPVRLPFDGHKAKLRTILTVGQGPDMARVDWSFVGELARKNAIVDLGTYGFNKIKSQYLQGPLESTIIDSKYYGIPDQSTCVALFYNRELFRKAGFENPDEALPKTWEEFVGVSKKLTDNKGQYAFAITNTLWWNLAFLNCYGARVISADGKKCILDSDNAITAIEMLADLTGKHKVEAGAWRPGAITPEQGFINGKYAMILMGNWNLTKFNNTELDYGVALIPAGSAGTSTNVGGTDLVLLKHSKYGKECYNFMTFLTNAQNQKIWCSKLNQLPTNIAAYDLIKFEDPHLMVFMEQMKHAGPNPVVKDYSLLENLVNPEIEAALSGQKSVKAALQAATKKVQERILDDK